MLEILGRMIWHIREEVGISQKDIARGIVSTAELCKIEYGEKEIDYFLLEALFQRLGKSIDKIEWIVTQEEYRLLYLRDEIIEGLQKRKYETVEKLLEKYQWYTDEKPLHIQYRLMVQAVMEYLKKQDEAECISLLEQAIKITFSDWKETEESNMHLCRQELQVLLMLAYIQAKTEDKHMAVKILSWVQNYIEHRIADEEEMVKIYPHCELLLGMVYYDQREYTKAYQECVKGKECLIKNGSLVFMYELLQLEAACKGALGKEEELSECEHYLEVINFLYRIANRIPNRDIMIQLMASSVQSECIISNEMIKELREAQGMTQEALSEDICTQETLSRIESGKRSPNKKNLYKLMRKMGVEREKYYGFIASEDYRLYEKVRLYKKCVSRGERENAHKLLGEIESQLDMSITINQQFVKMGYIRESVWEHSIDYEQAIEQLKELLYLTMPPIPSRDMVYRVPYRQEFVILNSMALYYKRNGYVQETINIYRQVKRSYDQSKIYMQYHAIPGFLLYINYTGMLEVNNELELAEEIGLEGIRHALLCYRGDVVGQILANLSCVYEKQNKPEIAEAYLRNGYFIVSLYEREQNRITFKEVYEKKYLK